jgi:hypothetical protein
METDGKEAVEFVGQRRLTRLDNWFARRPVRSIRLFYGDGCFQTGARGKQESGAGELVQDLVVRDAKQDEVLHHVVGSCCFHDRLLDMLTMQIFGQELEGQPGLVTLSPGSALGFLHRKGSRPHMTPKGLFVEDVGNMQIATNAGRSTNGAF